MAQTDTNDDPVELATSSPRLHAIKDGTIGWMVFDNPEKLNALSVDMWQAIPEVMQLFDADDDIRTIVLRGAGEKAFIVGADISEFEKARAGTDAVRAYDETADRAWNALSNAAKPTIAMVDGFCIGGGLGVALCCDLRIATPNSTFAIPAAKLGVGYSPGGLKKLVALVGPSFAKEIMYTARRFSSEEAIAMGLINRVLPKDELETFVRDYCAIIAQNAPLTIRAAKITIDQLSAHPESFDRALCNGLVRDCFHSEDYQEGRTAFMEKRPPAFKGR